MRVLRYECICTVVKYGSTMKLVFQGHSYSRYECESTVASLPLMVGK